MITQPTDIEKIPSWDGWSTDRATQQTNRNKDTTMGFAEHQRIACAAGALLTNMNFSDDDVAGDKAKAALMRLKDLYESNDAGTLYISKGIHQPYGNAHMQLIAEIDDVEYVYHLEVSATQIVTDKSGNDHFHWVGIAFTSQERNDQPEWATDKWDFMRWPIGAAITPKRDRDRRNSISASGLVAVNRAIDEENARRKAESDKALHQNKVLATILDKLKMRPKDKTQAKKLWAGEPAIFLTKANKPVSCTFDGKLFTQLDDAGQKKQSMPV